MTYKLIGIIAYFGILLAIGVVASRRMRDIRDYFAAGKQLGFWSVAFSARATGESAWLLLGLTGMGAFWGVHAFWVVVGEVVGVSAAWLLMSRRFKRLTDRYDSITVPDYLESRFRDDSHRIRVLSAFALSVFVTIYVSANIHATGTAFRDFLDWNYYVGALVGFAVVLAYSTSGGFLAVAWSDIFQGALMFLGLVTLPLVGLWALGGLGELSSSLSAIDAAAGPDGRQLLSWSGGHGWNLISVCQAIGFVAIGVGFMGSPQIFVRFLALKSETEITRGAAVAIVWTLLADSGAVMVGLVGRALLTDAGQGADVVFGDGAGVAGILGASGQGVLPALVAETMPAILVGLFIAIVLAATMSTIDSLLVLAASAVVRDYYQKVRHPELPDEALVPMSRRVTLWLACIALTMALIVAYVNEQQSVFWYVIFGWSGIAATFCPAILLSLFWSRMTARATIAAMVTGFVAVPFFSFVAPNLPGVGPVFGALSELPPAVLTSLLAGLLVGHFDREGQARLSDAAAELEDAAR